MLFTWDTTNLCIVFRGWRIDGMGTLIFSLLAIVLLTAGYEAVREISRRYEAYEKRVLEGRRGADDLRGESHNSPVPIFKASLQANAPGSRSLLSYHILLGIES